MVHIRWGSSQGLNMAPDQAVSNDWFKEMDGISQPTTVKIPILCDFRSSAAGLLLLDTWVGYHQGMPQIFGQR